MQKDHELHSFVELHIISTCWAGFLNRSHQTKKLGSAGVGYEAELSSKSQAVQNLHDPWILHRCMQAQGLMAAGATA